MRKAGKLSVLLRHALWRRAILRQGVAAAIEHRAFLTGHAFDVIVDVGANRGQFSLAARGWQPQAHIIAFEPLPRAAQVYRAVFDGHRDVTLHPAAIALSRGESPMQLSGREDLSSLLGISPLQSEYFPGTQAAGTTNVRTAPLADFVSADDLCGTAVLKIDVQGFELEVLKASLPLLPLFRHVYVEASFVPLYQGQALAHEVIRFLQDQGFVLKGFYNPYFAPGSGNAIQADLLFSGRR